MILERSMLPQDEANFLDEVESVTHRRLPAQIRSSLLQAQSQISKWVIQRGGTIYHPIGPSERITHFRSIEG
jgi:hypothetical protein